MISQSVLFEAKAFLCWEKFPQLSIQLIPIEKAIAFFYPPTKDMSTINLFYEKHTRDFCEAICLLFHEAGHAKQWQDFYDRNKEAEFWAGLRLDKGRKKIEFEENAWQLGQELLNEFLTKMNMNNNILINFYQRYAEQSLRTYK